MRIKKKDLPKKMPHRKPKPKKEFPVEEIKLSQLINRLFLHNQDTMVKVFIKKGKPTIMAMVID